MTTKRSENGNFGFVLSWHFPRSRTVQKRRKRVPSSPPTPTMIPGRCFARSLRCYPNSTPRPIVRSTTGRTPGSESGPSGHIRLTPCCKDLRITHQETPSTGLEFDALGYGETSSCNCMPADNDGAPGTTEYTEFVNTFYAVYSKTGSLELGPGRRLLLVRFRRWLPKRQLGRPDDPV